MNKQILGQNVTATASLDNKSAKVWNTPVITVLDIAKTEIGAVAGTDGFGQS